MSATCRRHDTECRRLGKKTTRRHPTCGAKLIFLSGAKSYWYTLNTCHEHGIHLANRFGMTHEHYVALLVAADLAKYVNGVLTNKLFQWENFLQATGASLFRLIDRACQ